jgi:F-box-like
MCKFPPEIFIAIFSLLPPRDLPSVIRLSKTFRDIGRFLLYKSVDLRSDDIHIQSTILLLQQKAELSKNIQHATLTTRRQSSTTAWIPANFLNGWNNLRSLKMTGVPFRTTKDQGVFRDNLMSSCTSLTQFTYRPGADPFPGPDFELSGLKRLSWQTEQAGKWSIITILATYKLNIRIVPATLDRQIISIMRSSMATLTHISFTGHLSLLHPTYYYDFLDLMFPLLTSLELGSLFDTTSQGRSNTAITRFIIAHPSIHHLSLGKFCMGPTSFQFDGTRLSEDSLPNLRSFEGFPVNITLLVHCNVRSLLELTTLSLYSDRNNLSLAQMFETVQTRLGHGHFPCVRNLRFEFHTDLSHRMETNLSDLAHRRWIDRFSEICPAVVNWYGRLGPVTRVSFKLYLS